jgi:hypothetical protein
MVSLLSPLVGGRIFLGVIEQGSLLPAIAYESAREPLNTLLGPTGDINVHVTLTLVGQSGIECRDLAQRVRKLMAQSPEMLGQITEEPGDDYDEPTKLHLYVMRYSLWEDTDN